MTIELSKNVWGETTTRVWGPESLADALRRADICRRRLDLSVDLSRVWVAQIGPDE